eukprot:CAMPEP_0171337300 /NCGR_PEP_ID=MMETSP0878-20121228/6615_1 /TAXON_ID=67004 /ORGANISM="Thalassiosira weissflogii, Strain CCMP1336" /LENGTH=948 /DNA_ID=CAMNT_0011838919 /DNA_START=278 /DNA_END=3124 /DNA_ORIENTATION=-
MKLYSFPSLLLAAAIVSPLTVRPVEAEDTVKKTFRFKDDFFLKFIPLETAIAPVNNEELMSALNSYAESFRDKWVASLEEDLAVEGKCGVDEMALPEFSIAQWRYPDYYDISELPNAGQSYIHPDTYVQRLYYDVKSLVVTCEGVTVDYLDYRDLVKDKYTEAAFSSSAFLESLRTSSSSATELFSSVESIEYDVFSEENADLFVQRYTDVSMYLKCLEMNGYGPDVANVLIEGMDKFFEMYVENELESVILGQVPDGKVFNFASPYDNNTDRDYFRHGPYYTGGNLINQVEDDDGILITEYKYGFDVVWFWPHDTTDDIIPDVFTTVNGVFDEGAFLAFLKQEYPDYENIQNATFCEGVETMPEIPDIPIIPTSIPTAKPTTGLEIGEGPCTSDSPCSPGLVCHEDTSTCVCDINTDFGCKKGNVCEVYEDDEIPMCYCNMNEDNGRNGCKNDQICRFSCAYLVDTPRCFDDNLIRDCEQAWGEFFVCADSNGDGVIDINDKSGGCDYFAPTMSPTFPPTKSPSEIIATIVPTAAKTPSPTASPIVPQGAITAPPTAPVPETLSPTVIPTPSPTLICDDSSPCPDGMCCIEGVCRPCITDPGDGTNPIVGTCGNGFRGDGICAWEGYCCSEWGWCGTTAEYCEGPSSAPTPFDLAPTAPTPSLDAGRCGNGEEGEGLCADENHCCSQWGYCGEGEGYCYEVDDGTNADGSCGAGGVGDGICRAGHCCSMYGFCGEGEEYCTGQNQKENTTELEQIILERAPAILPEDLVPQFGYRCGFTEFDARSNCKKECTHHVQCDNGEQCWGTQLNYCHTFEEGTHPVCKDLDKVDDNSRCGFDELTAREFCGAKCQNSDECGEGQECYPTMLNLCDCFAEMDEDGSVQNSFANASSVVEPFFLNAAQSGIDNSPIATEYDGKVEGKPRNSASLIGISYILYVSVSVLAIFAMY